jgi:hypothetical protein
VRIAHNIKVDDDIRKRLLDHYTEQDVDHPLHLQRILAFHYLVAVRDGAGNLIDGCKLGYFLAQQPVSYLTREIVFPFDNGRKFFAIWFHPEEFDENAYYILEYFDKIWYILME